MAKTNVAGEKPAARSAKRLVNKVAIGKGTAGDVHLQLDGAEIQVGDVRAAVLADIGTKVSKPEKLAVLDIYVKPADGKAYYVATVDGSGKEIDGSVDL